MSKKRKNTPKNNVNKDLNHSKYNVLIRLGIVFIVGIMIFGIFAKNPFKDKSEVSYVLAFTLDT